MHILIHLILLIIRSLSEPAKPPARPLPKRPAAPPKPRMVAPPPTPTSTPIPAPTARTAARPVAMPAGFAGIDSLIAQGRVALALDKLQLTSVLPRGPKEPKAPAVLVVATALEAAIRKEPRLGRFSGEVRGVASVARSVNELREEHETTPSKQLRHEIDALESRCVRELGQTLDEMKGALALSG